MFILCGAPGTTTGVSAPHSASSLRSLVLNHEPLEHSLLITTHLHYHFSELRQRFAPQLLLLTDKSALEEEPSLVPEPPPVPGVHDTAGHRRGG